MMLFCLFYTARNLEGNFFLNVISQKIFPSLILWAVCVLKILWKLLINCLKLNVIYILLLDFRKIIPIYLSSLSQKQWCLFCARVCVWGPADLETSWIYIQETFEKNSYKVYTWVVVVFFFFIYILIILFS